MRDFYYILGTDANCTSNEIRDAYRRLSKKFHPDLNDGDRYFINHFNEINEAYETLIDPFRRERYDEQLNQFAAVNRKNADRPYQHTPHIGKVHSSQLYTRQRWRPGIVTSIALLAAALVFGIYLTGSLISSKKHRLAGTAVVSGNAAAPIRHKKKHKFKNRFSQYPLKTPAAKPTVNQTVQVPAIKKDQAATPAKIQPKIIAAIPLPAGSTDKAKPAALSQPLPPVVNSAAPDDEQSSSKQANNAKRNTINPTPVKSSIPESAGGPAAGVKAGSNNEGYLYSSYVKPNVTGIVNMRESDNYGSAVIGVIPAKTKVLVLERGSFYYKVTYNGRTGYIPKWSLQTK